MAKGEARNAAGPQAGDRVQATRKCYYDHAIRNAGDVFDLVDEMPFEPSYMRVVPRGTALESSGPNDEIAQRNHATIVSRARQAAGIFEEPVDGAPDVLNALTGKK